MAPRFDLPDLSNAFAKNAVPQAVKNPNDDVRLQATHPKAVATTAMS
ncbi:MAG: hypothetical protein ABR878_17295 [Roseiarcus sp.]|jgi:hypothetical protein